LTIQELKKEHQRELSERTKDLIRRFVGLNIIAWVLYLRRSSLFLLIHHAVQTTTAGEGIAG